MRAAVEGDLLAHAAEWTDVPSSELLSTTRGAAPVSAGASAELERWSVPSKMLMIRGVPLWVIEYAETER